MLSLRTRRGPVTDCLNTPVNTVFPRQDTSCGVPMFTESKVPTTGALGWIRSVREDSDLIPARVLETHSLQAGCPRLRRRSDCGLDRARSPLGRGQARAFDRRS